MKSCVFVLFALFLNSAIAQTLFPRLGITGSSNSQKADNTTINPGIGFTAGAGYNQQISEMFSLQLEINYIQKVFSKDYSLRFSQNVGTDTYYVDEKIEGDFRLSYLEMPFLAKFHYHKLFVSAGPYGALGLGGSYKYDHTTNSSYLGATHDSGSSDIEFGSGSSNGNNIHFDNRVDIGFQAGLGILLFEKLILEGRYSRGSNLQDDVESRNQSIQFTASWPFKLK